MYRPRILVVDPDPAAQDLVCKVLGKHCDLYFHADLSQLFDALELFEPDLVILDLALPGLSGFELIGVMQGEEALQPIPLLVCSTTHDVETQKLVYRLGAHFQAKPCRPSQLFKSAAMFWRAAENQAPPVKQRPLAEAERLLAEHTAQRAASNQPHPLLRAALAAHARRQQAEPRAERSVIASITTRRPPDR